MIAPCSCPGRACPRPGRTGAVRISLEAVARALRSSREVRAARAQVELADAQVTAACAGAPSGRPESRLYADDRVGVRHERGFELPDSSASRRTRRSRSRTGSPTSNRVPLAGLAAMGACSATCPSARRTRGGDFRLADPVFRRACRRRVDIADKFESRLNLRGRSRSELRSGPPTIRPSSRGWKRSRAGAGPGRAVPRGRTTPSPGRSCLELDLTRAEVSRDNLHPQLVQARNAVELAMLNYKRLLDLPRYGARIDDGAGPPSGGARRGDRGKHPDLKRRPRSRRRSGRCDRGRQVDIAKGAFLPSVALTTSLQPALPLDRLRVRRPVAD